MEQTTMEQRHEFMQTVMIKTWNALEDHKNFRFGEIRESFSRMMKDFDVIDKVSKVFLEEIIESEKKDTTTIRIDPA